MKPIRLTIEGVFSYKKKQVIDFRKLSAGGIFGIFGNTGSGKSSIIEALIFVLYGKLDRISVRRVDIINLMSKEAKISFEFESLGKNYLAEANVKRKKETQGTERRFYVMEDGEYRSVGENVSAEDIIGLSYENFCKIVIIPQGKFQAFFSLKPAERMSMLKEIFPALREFDLTYAVKELENATKTDLDVSSGKLNQLAEYTEEALKEAESSFSKVEEACKCAEMQREHLERSLSEAKALFQLFEEKEKTEQIIEQQKQQLPQISSAEKELASYELANDKFRASLSVYDNCSKQIADTEKKQAENAGQLEAERLRNKKARSAYDEILEEDKQTTRQTKEITELTSLINLQEVKAEKAQADIQLAEARERESKGKGLLQDLEKEIKTLADSLGEKEADLPEPKRFAAVKDWFYKMEVLCGREKEINEELGAIEKQIGSLFDKLEIKRHEDFVLLTEQRQKDLQQRIAELDGERLKWLQEQAISTYSASLVDNEPCPLCGSLSHPKPADRSIVDKRLAEVEADILNANKCLDDLKKAKTEYDTLFKQYSAKKAELNCKRSETEQWKKSFVWAEYEGKTFEDIKAKEAADNELRNEIADRRKELETLRQRSDKYVKRLQEIADSINEINNKLFTIGGKMEQMLAGISEEMKANYSSSSVEELKEEQRKRNAVLEKRNAERISRNAVLEKSNAVLIRMETNENNYRFQIEQQKQQKAETEAVLMTALQQSEFENLEQVREVLNKNMDVRAVRDRINEFHSQKKITDNRHAELLKQTDGKIKPEAEKIKADEQTLVQKREELKTMLGEKGKKEGSVRLIKEKLEEKHELEKEHDVLSARYEGLKELSKMFKGENFVKFISSVYIEQLCSKANERLRIISNGKFEICYIENNFFVADYLNEGKTRSIKTLSGGQMFQASLCMALALVDTIRLNSNTNQDFFFIDEGFGTQDTESLDLIYQSLKTLRKEEKTVGLISHSDALKERITNNISVRMDEREGSIIEYGVL